MADNGDHPPAETHAESFDLDIPVPNPNATSTKSLTIRAIDYTDVACDVKVVSSPSIMGQGRIQKVSFEMRSFGSDPTDKSLTCTYRSTVNVPGGGSEQRSIFQVTTATQRVEIAYLGVSSGIIKVHFDFTFSRDARSQQQQAVSPPSSMATFGTAWLNESKLSDVVITCGDMSFNCHKVILAGRSPVFRRMLTSQFKEAMENKVEIVGFEPEVAELLIKFIYTDDVLEESISWELFEAAKMYDLFRLQQLCLRSLWKNISVQNCCRMLEAAIIHDLEEYFVLAMNFFRKNKDEVSNSEGWKEQVLTNNALLGKIVLYQMRRKVSIEP